MLELDWPREWHAFTEGQMMPVAVNKATTGLLTGEALSRVSGPFVEYWTFTGTFAPMERGMSRDVCAFMARLDGTRNILRMYDPMAGYMCRGIAAGGASEGHPPAAAGTGGAFSDGTRFTDGTGFLSGSDFASVGAAGHAGSRFVTLTGLVPSQPVSLDVNDMFSIRHMSRTGESIDCLYQAVTIAASDDDGLARVQIRPSLRLPVREGDIVSFSYPRSRFRLKNPESCYPKMTGSGIATFSLTLIEELPLDDLR